MITFAELGVTPSLVAALARRGITSPTEIQALVVRDGMAGKDIIGRAPTGSGKWKVIASSEALNSRLTSSMRPSLSMISRYSGIPSPIPSMRMKRASPLLRMAGGDEGAS